MRVIVVGNEKGGAGKSTVAVHLAVALLHEGARVAVLDLDLRQQSVAHFFQHRAQWAAANNASLPQVTLLEGVSDAASLDAALAGCAGDHDFLLIDTPGSDTELSRHAHRRADQIVTPMNDSFVDFEVLGVVDPVSLELVRASHYSELVWEARKLKAAERGRAMDWVVLRNRLASVDARNRRRVDERVKALSRRVGFRSLAGLRDRVIYRELFPFGLTVSDLSATVRPVSVSLTHIAARQELRVLMSDLGLASDPATILAAE
ncbi:MAG TPA: division plane positioning ATPase MipZ [Caulobacteraceae bacterium]|jgi:chromosome partitioning protein|nr:division plane positioning ATPase MipZ [Caulobacteraceae bacterium]